MFGITIVVLDEFRVYLLTEPGHGPGSFCVCLVNQVVAAGAQLPHISITAW